MRIIDNNITVIYRDQQLITTQTRIDLAELQNYIQTNRIDTDLNKFMQDVTFDPYDILLPNNPVCRLLDYIITDWLNATYHLTIPHKVGGVLWCNNQHYSVLCNMLHAVLNVSLTNIPMWVHTKLKVYNSYIAGSALYVLIRSSEY